MNITEPAAMTRAEAEALVNKWIVEAEPITPGRDAEITLLASVWVAGRRHGLGQVTLTDAERDALFASTIAPDVAAACWEDGVSRATGGAS